MLSVVTLFLASLTTLQAAEGTEPRPEPLTHLLVHRPFNTYYTCGEHREGELPYLGDALGADCVVEELVEEDGRSWARAHTGDGSKNEQWFGWRQEVLAPINGTVARINRNEVTNQPGHVGEPPATFVVIRRADGAHALVAHLRELKVEEGQEVKAGQAIGRVGNNGYGRSPHIHLGAWKDDRPLQLRFDLTASGD